MIRFNALNPHCNPWMTVGHAKISVTSQMLKAILTKPVV